MEKNNRNIPTVLVILGATGDLVQKKVIPALFHLYKSGVLPDHFTVVGYARRNLTQADFREYVADIVVNHFGKKKLEHDLQRFLTLFEYSQGQFEEEVDYGRLSGTLRSIDDAWGICSNKLFYLAVPPDHYSTIFHHLSSSKLTEPCSPQEGWTRVLVEKPFGKDLKTSEKLDELLVSLFKEEQLYRIDHYLAKQMLQNILAFRFSNNFLEKSWNNNLIESIHIRLFEKLGVEKRGAFYDGVGALRDVGQNHLLQMLALVTMERPLSFSPEAIRKSRAELLSHLKSPGAQDIKESVRGQYAGYRKIKGVKSRSTTETYFKVQARLDNHRWSGVPITLESGKRLFEQRKDIEMTFKHPSPCLCPPGDHQKNKLIINLEPTEGISIKFLAKKPGFSMDVEERTFNFNFRDQEKRFQYIEEYEKLLLDCIAGDQTLFVGSDEIRPMWKFTDAFIKSWQKNKPPLRFYKPDSQDIIHVSEPSASFGRKEIGFIGLGKMGSGLARQLLQNGWTVYGYDKNESIVRLLEKEGLRGAKTIQDIVSKLKKPALLWVMAPAGKLTEEIIFKKNGLTSYLKKGDIIIDGGNSFYEDSVRRARILSKRGIHFVDAGVSGGPGGALRGAAIMVGGDKKIVSKLEGLFEILSVPGGYLYVGSSGSGHFVKMVHNGIEYGMMQSLAEGFAILNKSPFKLNLERIAELYNHGTVIESKLTGWLAEAYRKHGSELKVISGTVGHTGEGEWTIKTANKLHIPAPVIKKSYDFRVESGKNPSYIGKILSALRNQFGGHEALSSSQKKKK